ncbi:hypothetical protein CJP16_10540 [Aeromonas sobria]|uniref:Uncharacterized protein n=1 Tax=Aeromonas sobria TaxID=646 RepID=A0A2N3IZ93_AERSO|nr:hypothetical protein [Aeromonas sobria]PKQ78359.1 hypothetical protein CJP16_10540 [Aeromonas sobria]
MQNKLLRFKEINAMTETMAEAFQGKYENREQMKEAAAARGVDVDRFEYAVSQMLLTRHIMPRILN